MSDDRLRADYEAAGFGRRLEPGRRPALLLIDLVRAYFTPGSELYLGDDACLASAARLLAVARRCGVPVVHTRVRYAEGGADGGVFFRKVGALARLVGDSPDGQIMPQVAPQPGEPVVVKQYASAFFGTSVRATAVDACQHGFVPLVVRDAVGDRDPGPHEANLFDLQAKYAEVVNEQTATRYLESVAVR